MKVLYAIRFSASWGIVIFLIYVFSFIYIPLAKLARKEKSEELKIKSAKEACEIFKEALNNGYRDAITRKQCKNSGQKCIYGYEKICWPEGCKVAKSFNE